MTAFVSVLLLLHVLALHTSIAAMEVISWLTLAVTVVHKVKIRERFEFPLGSWFLALSLIVLLSLVINPSLKPLMDQFGFMRFVLVLYGLYWALGLAWSKKFEQNLLTIWCVVLALTSLYAILQFFTGVDFIRASKGVVNPQEGGFFKTTGFFSMSLTFAYVIGQSTFAAALAGFRGIGKKIAVVILVLGGLATVSAMSRGAWISLFICGGIYFLFNHRGWLIPYILGVAVFVYGLMNLNPAVATKVGRMATLEMDHSSAVRTHLWRSYGHIVMDKPFLGAGLFQGDRLLPDYYQRLGIDEKFTSHAHNVILQWAAGAGVFAAIIYILISFYFMRAAWRIRDKSAWGWPLLLAQGYVHLGGLTEANFFDGEVNHFVVFIWALVLVNSRGRR